MLRVMGSPALFVLTLIPSRSHQKSGLIASRLRPVGRHRRKSIARCDKAASIYYVTFRWNVL